MNNNKMRSSHEIYNNMNDAIYMISKNDIIIDNLKDFKVLNIEEAINIIKGDKKFYGVFTTSIIPKVRISKEKYCYKICLVLKFHIMFDREFDLGKFMRVFEELKSRMKDCVSESHSIEKLYFSLNSSVNYCGSTSVFFDIEYSKASLILDLDFDQSVLNEMNKKIVRNLRRVIDFTCRPDLNDNMTNLKEQHE